MCGQSGFSQHSCTQHIQTHEHVHVLYKYKYVPVEYLYTHFTIVFSCDKLTSAYQRESCGYICHTVPWGGPFHHCNTPYCTLDRTFLCGNIYTHVVYYSACPCNTFTHLEQSIQRVCTNFSFRNYNKVNVYIGVIHACTCAVGTSACTYMYKCGICRLYSLILYTKHEMYIFRAL